MDNRNLELYKEPEFTWEETMEPWEDGMTKEELEEAERKQRERENQNDEQVRLAKELDRVVRFIEPWFPNTFTQILFDLTYQPMKNKNIETTVIATIYLTAMMTAFCLGIWVVGKISGVLVFITYVGLFMATSKAIFLGLGLYWLINKIRRMMARTDRNYAYEFHATAPGNYNFAWCETYVAIIVIIAMAWLVHGSEYAPVLQSTWLLIVMIILAKMIPGVGGNSSMNALMLVFALIVAIITVPDVWRMLLQSTKAVLAAPEDKPAQPNTAEDPMYAYAKLIQFDFSKIPAIGYSYTNGWDVVRVMMAYFPQVWICVDDLVGPGVAIGRATEIKAKNPNIKGDAGWASIYTGLWWVCLVMQMFMAWYAKDFFSLLLMTLVTMIGILVWNITGRREWTGRGQGVTMTDVRNGYSIVFGQGPIGLRIFVLRACTIVAWICLLTRNVNNIVAILFLSLGLVYKHEKATTFMLGIATCNPVWIITAFFNAKPVTQSLLNNSVDAYTPGDTMRGVT